MEENEIVMENDVILPDSDIKFDEGDAQPEAEPTAVKEEPSKAAEVDYSKLEIPIKFLKEEKKVPFEEAQKLIQIGMNEDRKSAQLQAQLDALKGKAELIANLAQLNNLSEDDLIKNLNAEIENTKLQNIKNGKEIPDEIAKELLESRKFREEIQNKESERIAKENESKELTDFIATFPTVKADEIPTEVWDIQKNGTPLKYAYQGYLLKQIEKENQILKQNTSNDSKASIPNTTENVGTLDEKDDFLRGFDGV